MKPSLRASATIFSAPTAAAVLFAGTLSELPRALRTVIGPWKFLLGLVGTNGGPPAGAGEPAGGCGPGEFLLGVVGTNGGPPAGSGYSTGVSRIIVPGPQPSSRKAVV